MKIVMISDLAHKSKEGSGAERLVEVLAGGMREVGISVDTKTFFPKAPSIKELMEYDLIHIHNFSMIPPDLQSALIERKNELPLIVQTVHDYTYLCRNRHGLNDKFYPCSFFGKDRKICVNCVPFVFDIRDGLLDIAEVVVADSVQMEGVYRRAMPDLNLKFVHLGIPYVNHMTIRDRKRDTFLYMGRHSYEKGVFEMIAAFKGLHAFYPEAKLVMTHTGRDSPAIQLQVKRSGLEDAVIFTGKIPREEVETYIANCIAVLAPSVWEEPFNLTILEAWEYNRPVIASEIGAHSELLAYGRGGMLYRPYAIEVFTDLLLRFYENPVYANEFGRRGNDALHDYFNQERMVNDYIKIYDEVLK